MLAVLAPGQGSQQPGMLAALLERPGVAEQVARWSELAQLDLAAAGTVWDADAIRATEVAQPLLAVTALLSARGLPPAGVYAGHSVGGWAAAALAGVLSEDDCVRLVAARGRAVAACCGGTGGMAAVLGGTHVLAAIEGAGLTAANVNGAGQIVAAGPTDALRYLVVDGARIRQLPVAGAFHTTAMLPAAEALGALVPAGQRPTAILVADTDGTLVGDGAAYPAALAAATALPVRFDRVWDRLAALGVDTVVELAPAGVLSGLAKRCLPGVRVAAVDELVSA